jgi:hypothetical protein
VEGIRQDPVVAIEEKDEYSGDECDGAQLGERANLVETNVSASRVLKSSPSLVGIPANRTAANIQCVASS